jgi:hypothetical protein
MSDTVEASCSSHQVSPSRSVIAQLILNSNNVHKARQMDCASIKESQYIGKNGDTIQMLGDNQGALVLAKNPHLHERSKHIDICYHFIRDLTEKGKVVTSYINTVDMVADRMTKPEGRVVFERFKKLLGLMEC